MKSQSAKKAILCLLPILLVVLSTHAMAQKTPPETVTLQSEGGKFGVVPFSHKVHAEKEKIDCATCHHKDKDPKAPAKCSTCHLPKDVKDNAPTSKDAFHKNCQTCHKDAAAKGKQVPVKCNECHKK
jgi:hypothetical protein